jgi:hypothetical protein
MALYIIISIAPFGKVQNADKTILVKANKVKEVYVNNRPLGYDFSKMESKETDWFIFENTELNMNKILFWAKNCERGCFWAVDAFPFFQNKIDYYDENDMAIRKKKVFLDASNNIGDRIVFYPPFQDCDPIGSPMCSSMCPEVPFTQEDFDFLEGKVSSKPFDPSEPAV